VAIRNLWFNQTIKEAIDAPRLHHQIYPMELVYEFGILDVNPLFCLNSAKPVLTASYFFPQNIVQGLESIGHVMDRFNGGSSVCGVARDGDFITANADHRRDAVIGGF
jgi:gamma-glutamyltranspeptidase / glutathione hydrolase / leukotriene-C4 hydrolase